MHGLLNLTENMYVMPDRTGGGESLRPGLWGMDAPGQGVQDVRMRIS